MVQSFPSIITSPNYIW